MFQSIGITNNIVRILKCISDFFKASNHNFMGIYLSKEDIFCIQIRHVENDRYDVVYAERINADFYNDIDREDAIEALENSLNKAGIFDRRAVLYIDDGDAYCYSRNIHEFDNDDLSKAVHWDLEINDPFAGDYIEGYKAVDDKVLIGAVCHQDMIEYADWFEAAGIDIYMAVTSNKEIKCNIDVDDIAIDNVKVHIPDNIDGTELSTNGIHAIYAAVSAVTDVDNGIKFWLRDKKILDWRWDRISTCLLCVVCIISFISVGIQAYKSYEIDCGLKEQKEALYLLTDVLERKQRAEAVSTEIENRTKLLKELSKDSWPVYAILVHLGCINCDGVWLTDLSTDKDVGITLKGEAVSYNSLVKYYQSLEADKDFFSGETSLEKSDLQDNGNIVFQIKANLK